MKYRPTHRDLIVRQAFIAVEDAFDLTSFDGWCSAQPVFVAAAAFGNLLLAMEEDEADVV